MGEFIATAATLLYKSFCLSRPGVGSKVEVCFKFKSKPSYNSQRGYFMEAIAMNLHIIYDLNQLYISLVPNSHPEALAYRTTVNQLWRWRKQNRKPVIWTPYTSHKFQFHTPTSLPDFHEMLSKSVECTSQENSISPKTRVPRTFRQLTYLHLYYRVNYSARSNLCDLTSLKRYLRAIQPRLKGYLWRWAPIFAHSTKSSRATCLGQEKVKSCYKMILLLPLYQWPSYPNKLLFSSNGHFICKNLTVPQH